MKRNRIYNILSLLCNLSILYFTIDGFWYNFRSDVVRDDAWFGYTGFKSLRFFTVLSNLFVAAVAIFFVVKTIKNLIQDKYEFENWLVNLKFVATTCVTLTFFVVVAYLSPVAAANGKGYFSLFTNNNLYMHFLTPVLAMISFVLFEHNQKLKFKNSFLTLVPVLLYAIVYFVMVVLVGEANNGWADFYGFTLGGRLWFAPISAVVVILIALILANILRLCYNIYLNRISKTEQ